MHVIFGSAGFAKEVDWMLYEMSQNNYQTDYFVGRDFVGTTINGASVISDDSFMELLQNPAHITAYLAVGSPQIRKKIYDSLAQFSQLTFPSLVHPNLQYDKRLGKVEIGLGSIICGGNILTTDIKIGKFTHLNLSCTVGHDTTIGDFCTLSPGCNISGNVHIGNEVFLGTNAIVLERISIPNGTIIGAGSVVTKTLTEPGTYVGIPAKKIK